MKNVFLFVCLIAVGLVTEAQTYPYCKAGLFSELTYYSDISITHDLNVVYGSNLTFQGNPIDLALDLHFPNLLIEPLPLRPTIILVHGGGFTSGSKSDMTNYCVKLARAGYVAVTVDYRLGWDAIGGPRRVLNHRERGRGMRPRPSTALSPTPCRRPAASTARSKINKLLAAASVS